jgi:hypothetical protein
LDDCALLNVVEDSDSDEHIIQDFVWENRNSYKGHRENFMCSAEPQGAARQET